MKILLTTVSMDPVRGGGTTERTRQLALHLRQAGHEVMVATIADGSRSGELRQAGIPVYATGFVRLRFTLPLLSPFRLSRLVAQSDAIHILGYWNLLSVAVAWLARTHGKPYAFSAAGEFAALSRPRPIARLFHALLGRRMVDGSDAVITITDLERADVDANFGAGRARVVLIPNGVAVGGEVEGGTAPRAPPEILFVGRLAEIKGPDLLLAAFGLIAPDHAAARLVFAGPDFGMLKALQSEVHRLGLAERVRFLGFVDDRQRAEAFSRADFLVVPSRSEAMSLVALEAGLAGLPVVATRACGLDIMEQLGCGLLCEASPEGIAAALRSMLEDPDRRHKGLLWKQYVSASLTWDRLAGEARRHISAACLMESSVSVVIPVYNGERYLAAAIESVLDQDAKELELIVVDDGSTDASAEIASRYEPRLRLIRQRNQGQSAALAVGWSMARGTLVGYLSADDLYRPGVVAAVARSLERHPEAVLAYPDFGIIDEHGALRRTIAVPEFSRRRMYAELHCLPGPGALFRRSALERVGAWRSEFRQIPDLEFFLRLGLDAEFVRVPEVLADFRIHSGSTTYRLVPVQRADEPLRMVASFLAREGLPRDILDWTNRSWASAHYLTAILHGQSGRWRKAAGHYLLALTHDPLSALTRRSLGALRILLRPALGLAPGKFE